MDANAIKSFSTGLCPWLADEFRRLEDACSGGRLGHAWLVTGPWGVGKVNLALAVAERLLAPEATEPVRLGARTAAAARRGIYDTVDHRPDLHCVFPLEQKRTISVDQVRDACRQLDLSSLQGRAKVLLIEPAEAMTSAAANALLKTLEEPTADTYLWLVSHQPGRLLSTVRSRCQMVVIERPPADDLLTWLAEDGVEAESVAPAVQARELTPFQALDWLSSENTISIVDLQMDIENICRKRADAQDVADVWSKRDLRKRLEWLSGALAALIRARFEDAASKHVTESVAAGLHNAAAGLAPQALFSLLAQTDDLLGRLGSGGNDDLALRVLLLGFQDSRTVSRQS